MTLFFPSVSFNTTPRSVRRPTWVLEAPTAVWEIERTCVAIYDGEPYFDAAGSFHPAPQ